jgi:phosphoglycolate phosphatase
MSTLVDSREDLAAAVNHVLRSLGHPTQTVDDISPRIGNGLRRLLTDTLGLTDPEVLAQAKKIFEEYYEVHCVDQTVLYRNVASCLQEFSNFLKLGVVTNKPASFAEKILVSLKIRPYLGAVVGGDSTSRSKPHPEPVLSAMKQLGAEGGSTLIVGDGWQDLEAGKATGIRTCLVRYGFGFHPDLFSRNPDF